MSREKNRSINQVDAVITLQRGACVSVCVFVYSFAGNRVVSRGSNMRLGGFR